MTQNKTGNFKIWKWVAGIVASILIILAVAAIYLSAKWKPILTEKIKESVYNGSQRLYTIEFKNIKLNLLNGSAALEQVEIKPDSAVFTQLKKIKLAPTHLFQIKLASLQLNRVGIINILFRKKLAANSIVLDQPSINMIYNKVPRQPDTVHVERTLYQQISKSLKSIHVQKIKIVDADFNYIKGFSGSKQNSIKHVNINVDDFLLDSLSQNDTTRFYYTKDISFAIADCKFLSKNKMYTMKIDSVLGSATRKTIRIKGFKMIPMYPDLTFSRINKVQKDRYDLAFDQIKLTGVDFIRFNTEGSIHAKSLRIGPAIVAIFLNRELPPAALNKGNNFPHLALKRLPIETIIDTLQLRKVDIAYTEYNPITQKRGTLFFSKLTGNIFNVTNDSLQLLKNNHAVARISTHIQKAIKIDVNINFNLTSANGAFHYNGQIGRFDMQVLNPLSKALGLVEIESGTVQKANFSINANQKGSSGTVHFYYSNLKIKLLREGEDGEPAKEKGLLSLIANTILVKDANPGKGDPVRTAGITFQRTSGASFFNLMWKSVYVGIREIVGLGNIPIKGPQKIKQEIENKNEERKVKREKRKKKRAQQKAEQKTK